MAVGIEERRQILAELERQSKAQLVTLWRNAGRQGDFREYIVAAFPELAALWSDIASELAATWYEESLPTSEYVARAAASPKVEQLVKSVEWALNVGDATTGLDLLSGTLQRAVYDAARRTTEWNAELEGSAKWARHASASACSFCRMLATRGAVYVSAGAAGNVGGRGKDASTNFDKDGRRKRGGQAKGVRTRGKQKIGDKYHDNCHCVVIEVRAGGSYQAPDYVDEWDGRDAPVAPIDRLTNAMSGRGVMAGWDNPKLDPRAIDEAAERLAGLLEAFPDMKVDAIIHPDLRSFAAAHGSTTKKVGTLGAFHQSDAKTGTHALHFRGDRFADYDQYSKAGDAAEAVGFTIQQAGAPVASDVTHESGHAVEYEFAERLAPIGTAARREWFERRMPDKAFQPKGYGATFNEYALAQGVKDKPASITAYRKKVAPSEYAKQDNAEMFAESFAEWYRDRDSGNDLSPFAEHIGRSLTETGVYVP